MKIRMNKHGTVTVTLEAHRPDTLFVRVDECIDEAGTLIGIHYPLRALVISLPQSRTFISQTGVLYVLPEGNSSVQKMAWGCGENQIELRKWKPKIENGN